MKPKTPAYDNPKVGCYVDESSGSADDCNRRTIEFAQDYGYEVALPDSPPDNAPSDQLDDYSQALSEAADDAVDYLNNLETRTAMYWTFEDNSLFLTVDVDSAKEQVEFVSVKSLADARSLGIETDPDDSCFPPASFRGEWLHVSDHGNATLYCRVADDRDEEIWSVV